MVANRELELKDYLAMARRHWVLIVVLAAIGGGTGLVLARALPKRFTSTTTVLIEQPTVPENYVQPVVTEDINQRLAAMQEQILSRSRLEPLIRQFDLYPNDINQESMEVLVDRLRKAIAVTPVAAMTMAQRLPGFNVSVTFADPHNAQQICATVTSLFLSENLQLRQDQSEHTTQFIGKEVDDAKAKLDDQDAKLAAFKRQYFTSLPEREQTNLNILMGLNTQLEATTQALSRAQQDKNFAESVLTQQLAVWQASQAGQNPETMEQKLSNLEKELTSLQLVYTDAHPDVIKTKIEIANLKQKIADFDEQNGDPKKAAAPPKSTRPVVEPAEIQQLRAQIHQHDQVIREGTHQQEEIQRQIQAYQERVQSSPAVEQEYKELTRDYQTAQEFYNDLLKKRAESVMATDLERRQQGEQFRILDGANLPESPSFPNPWRFGGGGLGAGLALGLGLTLFFEIHDSSLRTERDVELSLGLPVLAALPVIAPGFGKPDSRNSLPNHAAEKAGAAGEWTRLRRRDSTPRGTQS